jgi:hypothetical protein
MSDCGVCISNAHRFDGPADIWESNIVKARRNYKCCECGRPIERGAKYERYDILFDGKWSHYRTCVLCAEISSAFCCDGRLFGNLWNDFDESEIWPAITTACFDRLDTPEAKAELRRRWMKWKGLIA